LEASKLRGGKWEKPISGKTGRAGAVDSQPANRPMAIKPEANIPTDARTDMGVNLPDS
jgi:hypothetical protein